MSLARFELVWLTFDEFAHFEWVWLTLNEFGSLWISLAQFWWVWLTLNEFGSLDEFGSLWMSLAQFWWGLDCKWRHVNYMYCVIKLMFLHCTYMLVVKLGQNKTFTYLFNSMVIVRWFSSITYRSLTVLIFTSWGFTLKSSFIIMLIQETWTCKWYWT